MDTAWRQSDECFYQRAARYDDDDYAAWSDYTSSLRDTVRESTLAAASVDTARLDALLAEQLDQERRDADVMRRQWEEELSADADADAEANADYDDNVVLDDDDDDEHSSFAVPLGDSSLDSAAASVVASASSDSSLSSSSSVADAPAGSSSSNNDNRLAVLSPGVAADLLPPEQAVELPAGEAVRLGTLRLNGVSVFLEANWRSYLVAKNRAFVEVDWDANVVTVMGRAPTGTPGADVWYDFPVSIARRFVFGRVELHNGARFEFRVERKDELCLDNMFSRTRSGKALEFWLDSNCSVISMPTLDNDMGGSQRTVDVSLGYKSIFAGKTGASVDHLRLHVRNAEAELKSYFVKVSARGVFDAIRGVKVLLGALTSCACDWTVNVAGKRAAKWRPRVRLFSTAPHSAERQAASKKDSRQTLTYRIEAWFRKAEARISSLRSAVEHRTLVVDELLSLPEFPSLPPPMAARYSDEVGDTFVDFEQAKLCYLDIVPELHARIADAAASSSSQSQRQGSKRSLSEANLTDESLPVINANESTTHDTICMVCQSAPASLFGKRCGHAYYCAECDALSRKEQPSHVYLTCPLCRRGGQALVPFEHVDKHQLA